jgi:hypothetical protein
MVLSVTEARVAYDWCANGCSDPARCVYVNERPICLDCFFDLAADLGVLDWLVSNRRVEVERLALRED